MDLNLENIKEYLAQTVLPTLAFSDYTISDVSEVTDQTYVNWIYKVELRKGDDKQIIYLRQTRDHVKKKPDIKMDAARIKFEVNILNLLQEIIPGIIPEVLFYDKDNNVAVLNDIKRNGNLLVHELLAGRPHPETGKFFGVTIAKVHGQTLGVAKEKVRGSEKENTEAVAFHLGMRLKPALEMYQDETKEFLKTSDKAKKTLVLGDLASKNIFIDGSKVRFLDLERAFVGDPGFDLAFLFCHYLIEVPPDSISASVEFITNFTDSYRQKMKEYLKDEEIKKLENRVIKFLGITILYRIFGFYLVVNVKQNEEFWKLAAYKMLADKKSDSLVDVLHKLNLVELT